MKSLSIHKIDDHLMALIQKKAKEKGLSLNKTIKLLLKEALGLVDAPDSEKKGAFSEFCGLWGEDEFLKFEERVADFNQIDEEDWK